MDQYRKSGPVDPPTSSPAADNELRVTMSKSINQLVEQGLKKLDSYNSVVIVSKGKAINRGITVVEIIKRRKDGKLHQYNQMGIVTASEQWSPVNEDDLDRQVYPSLSSPTCCH
ncbi:hypothetical protein DM01DRAFT_326070 [Hesseltinella vesiculosa]|uniref:DNA/RNA-binding protein Alba-like domain-containing protein n=1 Tax=Hesseltinella vesiculosa TaxID=101127 RepID=A0A1X2GVN3_9FUNG|nr:hypothetical protein DM01DRAFT_326070 [Hesseltinella vesiculosa]